MRREISFSYLFSGYYLSFPFFLNRKNRLNFEKNLRIFFTLENDLSCLILFPIYLQHFGSEEAFYWF
ncbi:conserved hypothetical protein [Leptospira interrogans serovar Copenhageni str. Fiocruz L1-130]|uniref:Uncharacterized protein n=1 Tax=Leptospira interrogans serogroup Icterohaemorrhagiae serovar copenhageni (strain Fiocruz L1-130) TaxID=267671 RepID=Q72RA6_LEPIC|nr:conserved hypothetical protein [Leptospira interrogans serovar Copenhageni str. Fiocruz L1-130]